MSLTTITRATLWLGRVSRGKSLQHPLDLRSTNSKKHNLLTNVWSYIYVNWKVSLSVTIYEIFAIEICLDRDLCNGRRSNVNKPTDSPYMTSHTMAFVTYTYKSAKFYFRSSFISFQEQFEMSYYSEMMRLMV